MLGVGVSGGGDCCAVATVAAVAAAGFRGGSGIGVGGCGCGVGGDVSGGGGGARRGGERRMATPGLAPGPRRRSSVRLKVVVSTDCMWTNLPGAGGARADR